ncbi:hypothetical protein [Chthoniobacter sp.]|uniref:hypothetical protein n=1 Tax=Chthoniobacter sp. TaxID=2510640 RepID=UPI0032AFE5EA
MLALEEKRAALQQQIDEIHQQITATRDQIFDQASSTIAKAVRKVVAKGRTQRGALKAQILSALETAGHAGVRVTELAESLGTKAANLHAWFHATSKRMPSIIKVAGGHYRLNGNGHKPAPAPTKATKVKAKGRKPAKAKRGALSENILTALSGAGSSGVTIKDLSDQVGSNYRNVAVWFATTGKKNAKIKKVAPATYKLAA